MNQYGFRRVHVHPSKQSDCIAATQTIYQWLLRFQKTVPQSSVCAHKAPHQLSKDLEYVWLLKKLSAKCQRINLIIYRKFNNIKLVVYRFNELPVHILFRHSIFHQVVTRQVWHLLQHTPNPWTFPINKQQKVLYLISWFRWTHILLVRC